MWLQGGGKGLSADAFTGIAAAIAGIARRLADNRKDAPQEEEVRFLEDSTRTLSRDFWAIHGAIEKGKGE